MSVIIYRPDIQGLRAVAVLAVMAFHFNPAWLPGGFVGVDVFLVISGFLIADILLKKKSHSDYALGATLRYFYSSRFQRIVPAYFVMLVIVALLSAVLFLPQDFNVFKKSLEKAAYFNSSIYFAGFGDYFAPANHEQPLLHTWSLAVEIQFYLLAPFLILLLPQRILAAVLVALLVGLTLVAEYRLRVIGAEQSTYYSLYARLPEFFVGALAALYLHSGGKGKNLSGLGLLLILFAAVAQSRLGPFPGLVAFLPVLGSVLLMIQAEPGSASRFLSHRALVWVGALSYSLYLWHWPVLAFLRYYTGAEVLDLTYSLYFIILTLLLSVFSYYWIETPLRQSETRLVGYALLVFAVIGASFSMRNINDYFTPESLPIEYARYADPNTICHGRIVGDCLKGDLTSEREILVLGDSHAAMLNPFFEYLGKQLGFKARVVTASGCVTIPGFDYRRLPAWAQKPCVRQVEEVGKYIANAEIIYLVGRWSQQTLSQDFNTALRDFLQRQVENGKIIYVLPQVPELNENPLRTRRFRNLGISIEFGRDLAKVQANTVLAELASQYPSVHYVNLQDLEIFANAPFYDDKLIYFDKHHLNEVGARIYAQAAKRAFSTALLPRFSQNEIL